MIKLHEYYRSENFNPTTFNVLTRDNLRIHREKRRNLYVNHLAIPEIVWRDADVLEVGCSSGENTLLYAMMGARLTLVEPLATSIRQLKALFQRYRQTASLERIIVDEIAAARLKNSHDIIVVEGFLNSLSDRRAAIRKLFKLLRPGGLLILSTNDSIGSFIESFKAAIAKRYCRLAGISGLDKKVEAIRPFFEEDFESIPHSRLFASWAKDVLLNPIASMIPSYDFDEIVADLSGFDPVYHSSWPSYRPTNDLTWHKRVPDPNAAMARILQNYRLRRGSYLMGRVLDEITSIRQLASREPAVDCVPDVIKSMMKKQGGDLAAIMASLRRATRKAHGSAKILFSEMQSVFPEPVPETYRKCRLLRSCWGVPHHYIVFTK